MNTNIKLKNKAANNTKHVLGVVLGKIKKWNWTLFLVIICTSEAGAMSNKNIESISSAFLFGLVTGTILGLPLAILTKNVE